MAEQPGLVAVVAELVVGPGPAAAARELARHHSTQTAELAALLAAPLI